MDEHNYSLLNSLKSKIWMMVNVVWPLVPLSYSFIYFVS
jgi:hypothetical protein